MRNLAQLPKTILMMEYAGGLLLIAALLLVNHWLPAPRRVDAKTLATVLLFTGILLMLPAVWLMTWRTAKAMAPQLFKPGSKKR